MSGNDYQGWGPINDPYVTAVAQGIKDTDPGHIHTVQLNYDTSGSLDDPAWAPLISLNASYTYGPTYEQVLTDYNRSNFLPTFMVEGTYEFEQNQSHYAYGDPFALRRQEYWSMLSGATGQLYGNHYTWQFLCDQRDQAGNCVGGWKDHLDTSGALEFKHMTDLFQSLPWYQLVPDSNHTLLTGGSGTYGDWDYATAAKIPDGTLGLVYIPTARTVSVDLGTMAGPVTARWFDPASGTSQRHRRLAVRQPRHRGLHDPRQQRRRPGQRRLGPRPRGSLTPRVQAQTPGGIGARGGARGHLPTSILARPSAFYGR